MPGPIDYRRPSTPPARPAGGPTVDDVLIGLAMAIVSLPLLAVGLFARAMAGNARDSGLYGDPWTPPGPLLGAGLLTDGLRRIIRGRPPDRA